MVRKSLIIVHKTIDRVVGFVSLILFLICLYAMIDAYMVYSGANDNSLLKYKPQLGDASVLQELSEDAIAWLTIDNTKIDYPIMQGQTNETYLNKDPYGNYSLAGSIFLDSRNNKYFRDDYSLIYGHHMEYGVMFGSLDEFTDKSYFDEHRTGQVILVTGSGFKVKLFASFKVDAKEEIIFDPTKNTNKTILDFVKKNAIVYYDDDVTEKSKLIALSTCQSAENTERMIVFGTLKEIKNK
jgi:sortase B